MTTCSVGSMVAMLYSDETAYVDYRRGVLVMCGLDFLIPPLQAVVVLKYAQFVREYNRGFDLLKELMALEADS